MSDYLHSKNYDEKLLRDVLILDQQVYPQSFQGTLESVKPRFKAYPEMFIYRYDANNSLIGYICFFPISASLEEKIINNDSLYDDNISEINIKKGQNNAYLVISIAVNKIYQTKKHATALLNEMILKLQSYNGASTIYAYTINEVSEKLFNNFKFKTAKKLNKSINLKCLKLSK